MPVLEVPASTLWPFAPRFSGRVVSSARGFTFFSVEGSNATRYDQEIGGGSRFRVHQGRQGELFFHHSEVQGVAFEELQEGQEVEYQIGQGKKGPCATSVRVV